MNQDVSYDGTYREEQYREAATCMLLFSAVISIISACIFATASQSNIGLLAFPTYLVPILITIHGGWAFFVSLGGAYTLAFKEYMSKSKSGCCAEDPVALCSRVCCNPFKKPNTETVSYYTMPLRWLHYNLWISCILAASILLSYVCSPGKAAQGLSWRWHQLFQSQEGYAILLQNQDEYKCCGFSNDLDSAAQPCKLHESTDRVDGCQQHLVKAFDDKLSNFAMVNSFALIFLVAGLFFVRKEIKRVDQVILNSFGKSWGRTREYTSI